MAHEVHNYHLWRGYEDYNVYRGTTPATITLTTPAAAVEVDNLNTTTTPLYFTLEGTTPTGDGTGDTENVMIRVPAQEARALDRMTSVIKLAATPNVEFQVIVLR